MRHEAGGLSSRCRFSSAHARSLCPVTQDIAAGPLPPSSLLLGRGRRLETVELVCPHSLAAGDLDEI